MVTPVKVEKGEKLAPEEFGRRLLLTKIKDDGGGLTLAGR